MGLPAALSFYGTLALGCAALLGCLLPEMGARSDEMRARSPEMRARSSRQSASPSRTAPGLL